MDPQVLLESAPIYAALISLPFIPIYLRRMTPQLEVIGKYLKVIVEAIKEGKLP